MTKKIITRFAPSPTGFLHIGGARTALFNWLYAKHHGGKFLLRIEDTDKKRLSQGAVDTIIDGLRWLEINPDDEIKFQSQSKHRHVEVAHRLLESGHAYYCYDKPTQRAKNEIFRSKWRDNDNLSSCERETDNPVIRLKVAEGRDTVINDKIYGTMVVNNSTIEDFVILRSDGTPTYMLSVVVDDHDMGVTDVIRGSDHITNTAKQILIYQSLGWDIPVFAHIPLIHGEDGSKMSKRDGALSIMEYHDMGFLPSAMKNYLLNLGWSNGENEIMSEDQAIKMFDLENVGKAPARFDIKKLQYINNHYLRTKDCVMEDLIPFIADLRVEKKAVLSKALVVLTEKANTLVELAQLSKIFIEDTVTVDETARGFLVKDILELLKLEVQSVNEWKKTNLIEMINNISQKYKKRQVYQTLRAALTGTMESPSIVVVMLAIGKEITLQRIIEALGELE